jgi:hypothetical protein
MRLYLICIHHPGTKLGCAVSVVSVRSDRVMYLEEISNIGEGSSHKVIVTL